MIDAYILEHFSAFCKYGTISAASEKLNVSQPAVTRSMKLLEEKLGVKIFERTKNKLKLTDAGKLASEYTQKILSLEQEMMVKVKQEALNISNYQFGNVSYASKHIIENILRTSYPKSTVSGVVYESEDNLLKAIDEDRLIFTIISHEFSQLIQNKNQYYVQYFATEEHYAYVHKDNPIANKKELTIEDLKNETFVVISTVKYWNDILKTKLGFIKQINQENFENLYDIINSSTLTSFISNLDIACNPTLSLQCKDRVAIPIEDGLLRKDFYFLCKDSYKIYFEPIFDIIRNKINHN